MTSENPTPLAVPRFAGKTFAFTGNIEDWTRQRATRLIQIEGGQIVTEITAALDYLFHGRGGDAQEDKKTADKLNRQGASIRILKPFGFFALFLPNRELSLALLRGGAEGIKRWSLLTQDGKIATDLSGADLSQLSLYRAPFSHVCLDRADLTGADLSGASLGRITHARLDGANLSGTHHLQLIDCSVRGANLREAKYLGGCERSDFSGANLTGVWCYGTCLNSAVFCEADLTAASLLAAQLRHADFTGAKAIRAGLTEADLTEANCTRADLSSAHLSKAKLTRALLRQANLHKADLTRADLCGADLTGADLSEAILVEADLSNAILDGTNLAGANLLGAKLAGVDLGKVQGLDQAQTEPAGSVGPNLRELARVAQASARLQTTAQIELPEGRLIELNVTARSQPGPGTLEAVTKKGGTYTSQATTVDAAILDLCGRWNQGQLRLDSITVRGTKTTVSGKALKKLALAAWCEARGIPCPQDAADLEKSVVSTRDQLRQQLLTELRGGVEGVKKWNKRGLEERKRAGHFRQADLSGVPLDEANLQRLDFSGANFAGASLRKAELYLARLKSASFRGADCREAKLVACKLQGADFEEANLVGCWLGSSDCREASFRGADLSGGRLYKVDLRGADLSTANLTGAEWRETQYDEATRFPPGFLLPAEMQWSGAGRDPRNTYAGPALAPVETLDLDTFLKRLREHTDPGRLSNALQMLKAERFRLFNQVEEKSLVGIVKSQSNPELVYSCRLAADGNFSCCTQNLRICGGLQGAVCKHLLVLVVGLAKSGLLNPGILDQWIQASRHRKPILDKDAASAVFLRYKGAEAGEVDWRPTETIPEDFYAF